MVDFYQTKIRLLNYKYLFFIKKEAVFVFYDFVFQLEGLTNDALLAGLLIINNRSIIAVTAVAYNTAYTPYLVVKDA